MVWIRVQREREIEREHLSIKYAWKIRNNIAANNVDKLTKKY